MRHWLDAIGSLGAVSGVTLSDYRHHAERYLILARGSGTSPSDLTAEDLDGPYGRLVKEGMGARTINHVHATARGAPARRQGEAHPLQPRDADPPRYSTQEREYLVLSKEEVGRFFEAAEGDRFEAFFVAAVLHGARPAELRASK